MLARGHGRAAVAKVRISMDLRPGTVGATSALASAGTGLISLLPLA
jgi:hypothetical protein